ncbi:tetratricopeptide repeat protein [Cognatishimia sp. WU-CL00825]|uniref:tetratricopeptide repeat protein n=1 Tax=Cognatishimia sp. WU-CL00825 TaxID=3127658 RepID=UPI003107FF86
MIICLVLAACSSGGLDLSGDDAFAPARDTSGQSVSGLTVGQRLMDAGEYELALKAFSRAAAYQGLTADILASIGTANLGLGRLGQAERNLQDAIEKDEFRPEFWNNLGVVLMEQGKISEAAQTFKKAFALDNGESDSIRDNLRLALAKLKNPAYDTSQQDEKFKLVRRGSNDYLLQTTP